jgi:predicted dehydrogenase
MICTRHDSHASLALKALQAGKHVFVEKPMATSQNDIDKIKKFYQSGTGDKPLLMVGFNRRFSSYAAEIKSLADKRVNPLFIRYRMNAGYIPLDHWVHENGGRIVGEACHIIDLMTFLTGSMVNQIHVENISPVTNHISHKDNKTFILKYIDGSVATIDYIAVGNTGCSKEYMEIHFDQKTIIMDDYKSLQSFGVDGKNITTKTSQKGHFEELIALYDALTNTDSPWPIALNEMIQTSEIAIELSR